MSPSTPPRNSAPWGSTTAMRPVRSAMDLTMCCTQAKSPLESVGRPAKARPQGSLSQISRPHCSSENGGLATTTSNEASPPEPGSLNTGTRSVSPRSTTKSSMPWRNRFIRATAAVVRFFSWPRSRPKKVRGSPKPPGRNVREDRSSLHRPHRASSRPSAAIAPTGARGRRPCALTPTFRQARCCGPLGAIPAPSSTSGFRSNNASHADYCNELPPYRLIRSPFGIEPVPFGTLMQAFKPQRCNHVALQRAVRPLHQRRYRRMRWIATPQKAPGSAWAEAHVHLRPVPGARDLIAKIHASIAYCATCPTQRKETFPFPLQPAFTAPNSPSYP